MRFEWDDEKNRTNQANHGLSFSEAKVVFEGPQDYLEIYDELHSDVEDRFIAIGQILRGLAVVVYTERGDDLIRIIGARFATKRERERYRAYMDKHK